MNEWMKTILKERLHTLQSITQWCSDTMHEPDEQGISAVIKGRYLDNAGVEGELKVGLVVDTPTSCGTYRTKCTWFNMANLIALARLADIDAIPVDRDTGCQRTDPNL